MKIVIDIEANGLENPDKIWCIVCKDIDTDKYEIFRNVHEEDEKRRFLEFSKSVSLWIGHNFLGYDYPVLNRLVGLDITDIHRVSIDTLIVSKLANYSRDHGHSIEAYGIEFGYPKLKNTIEGFFTKWSQELENYCVRDVDITHRVYLSLSNIWSNKDWRAAIELEQEFQGVCNRLHNNGFYFDTASANRLLDRVTKELGELDEQISQAFPAKLRCIKEVVPRLTKYGTLNKSDFRWVLNGDLSEYNGGPFCRCSWQSFNPSSHRQIIEVLNQAGWSPTDKTKTHVETERELNRLKYTTNVLDKNTLSAKLVELKRTGWKVNEQNLSTLPDTAPPQAKLLARRIILEDRRRHLTEKLGLVQSDGRIHGRFQGIGAWTHRMAHQEPNMANIPNEYREDGTKRFLGKELRALWRAPRKRVLVGVDAEGIQLRIFAHYVNDPELINSLVKGNKSDKTDPHSLNQRVLGAICKTRQAAKRFLYALLLGGGIGKFAEILGCTQEQAREAVDKFNKRYPGFSKLKRERFPSDAEQGYFIGLDGRRVYFPVVGKRDREHLAMSGYLQNGEAIIMKKACLKFCDRLHEYNSLLVNFVHDEWQTETPNNMAIALQVAKLEADCLQKAGEELNLNCPMAGSYWNDDLKDYTIGTNWAVTH